MTITEAAHFRDQQIAIILMLDKSIRQLKESCPDEEKINGLYESLDVAIEGLRRAVEAMRSS